MRRYWEREVPVVVTTERNVLRYYPEAGRLQVSLPNWVDRGGELRPGKTVTVDLEALELSPDLDTAIRIIEYLSSRLRGAAATAADASQVRGPVT